MRCVVALMLVVILCGGAEALGGYELKESFEEMLPAEDLSVVSVSTRNGSIVVDVWDRDEVHVSAEKKVKARNEEDARKYMEELKVEIRPEDDELEIRTDRPEWSSTSGEGFWGRLFGGINGDIQASVSYEIQVPRRMGLKLSTRNGGIKAEGTEGSLGASSRNGDLRFRDIGGRVDVETRNGRVELADMDGDLYAATRNGDIRAEDVAGVVQHVHTRNGRVRLVNVRGVRKAVTRNGEIYADFSESGPEGGYFETRSSNITVVVPENISATIRAESRSGRVSTDFPITIQGQVERGSLHGRIGSGGPVLTFKTRNGAIRIEKGYGE